MISTNHNNLLHRLRRTRSVLLWTDLATRVAWLIAIASGLVFLAVAAESLLHMSVTARTVTDISVIALIVIAKLVIVLKSALRAFGIASQPTEEDIATLVGQRYPAIH